MKRQRRHLTVVFLLLFLAAGPAAGQEWTWTGPTNVSNTQYGSYSPNIAISPEGDIHVVWEDNTRLRLKYDGSVTVTDILYTHYDGAAWSTPVQISAMDTNSTFSREPKIALDSQGNPHVVWTHNGYVPTGEAYYSTLTDTGWTEPTNFTDDPYSTWLPDIVIDSQDRVHLVWTGLNELGINDVCYRSLKEGVWSDTVHVTRMTNRDAAGQRMALDSQDRVHCVWWRAYWDRVVVYSVFNGESWSPEVVVSTPDVPVARSPIIAIDSQDYPHIVWRQVEYAPDTTGATLYVSRVYYTHFDGQSWIEPEDILPEGADLPIPSHTIVISNDDTPLVGVNYYEDEDEWAHSSLLYRIDGQWTYPYPYTTESHSTSQSIVVDENNSLHVAITNRANTGEFCEIHYYRGDRTDGILDKIIQLPQNLLLLSSYPNPFNSTVSLRFALPARSAIKLIVYNSQGRRVLLLDSSVLPPGSYVRIWKGVNEKGEPVSSGVYFVQLITDKKSISQRITLVR